MSLFQAGGIAALICAATYSAGFVLLVTVLAPFGYGTAALDAASVVAFIHSRPSLMLTWNMLIYGLNAIALIILVVALSERLRSTSQGWSAFARSIGLIWAGLVLGAGMIANVAVERAAHLFAVDPSGAASLWSILHAVELGLGGGNEIAGGVWIVSISLLAKRASMIPWPLAALGMLVGAAGFASVIPPFGDVTGATFGLGAILWFAALGTVMLLNAPQRKAVRSLALNGATGPSICARLVARWPDILRWAVGSIFIAAGIAKFFPHVEDPGRLLSLASEANAGLWLAPFTQITVVYAQLLIPTIGMIMSLTGIAQIMGKGLRIAAAVQLVLMTCFVLILHRAFPAIFLIDGAIAAAILVVLRSPPLDRRRADFPGI